MPGSRKPAVSSRCSPLSNMASVKWELKKNRDGIWTEFGRGVRQGFLPRAFFCLLPGGGASARLPPPPGEGGKKNAKIRWRPLGGGYDRRYLNLLLPPPEGE